MRRMPDMRNGTGESVGGRHLRAAKGNGGVTFVELLVALPLAALIVGYLAYNVQNTVRMYNFSELKADMVQNAHYAAQRLTEVLTETGACLPNQTDSILVFTTVGGSPPRPVITRRYNPDCNAIFTVPATVNAKDSIWVDTLGAYFAQGDSVMNASGKTTIRWRRRIRAVVDRPNAQRADTIVVSTAVDVVRKDVIYRYRTERWSVTGRGQLYIYTTDPSDTSRILAENIDTLRVTFDSVTAAGKVDTVYNWRHMENGTVYVVARTERFAPGRNDYMRQAFSIRFRFKSKIED